MSDDRKSTTIRIFDKLERMETHLNEINITLVKQHASLEEHMSRTALLEKDVGPLKAHREQMRGAGKLLAILALIATIFLIFK